jgi:hypothetical protein
MNTPLAGHYFELSRDQGCAKAEFRDRTSFHDSDGIGTNRSLAAQFWVHAEAQFTHGILPDRRDPLSR